MKRALLFTAFAIAATTAGCSDDDDLRPQTTTVAPAATPPSLAPLNVPDYPPLSAGKSIEATCTAESGILAITAQFDNSVSRFGNGSRAQSVSFFGSELGEGMGSLRVRCCDNSRTCAEREVQNYIVDLSPPEIEAERLVASPARSGFEGEIAFWISDAWVLGSVEMTFGGKTLTHELPKAYPATVGKDWDVTRVTFPAKDLGTGTGSAVVIARDAAGNAVTKTFALRLDATPPTVSLASPASGAIVSGGKVSLTALADDSGNPNAPTIRVFAGGAPIAELPGPRVDIDIDTSTLPSGPNVLSAIAIDDAGNRSIAAEVTVEVP